MSTLKKAKPKRLLNLALALIMLLSMMPLPVMSAGAEEEMQSDDTSMLAAANGLNEDLPTWSTNPQWQKIDSSINQASRLNVLRKVLGYSDEWYIRLEADIEVSEAYLSDKDKIYVNGKKVLDLNGHKISIKLGKGSGYSGSQTAITVNSTATFMVIDSRGGGKIHGDTWICAPEDLGYVRASTDLFYNKGTLIINIPDGEIETGRSKQQWVTAASENGVKESIAYARYSGYIRGQSNGAAIIGAEKSKTVIVSGRVIGRGFYKFGESPWGTSTNTPYVRCSAVRTDGTLIMYGGEIYGMGGANVLSTGIKSNVIIYSGYFRTTTIDRLAVQADKQEDLTGNHANFTKKCSYGSFGFNGDDIAPDAEFFYGSHDATVRPQSVTDMTSDSIKITHSYDANVINPAEMENWVVYAYYKPYFSYAARNYIGNGRQHADLVYGYDYKLQTTWNTTAEFTVLDSKGNVVGYGDEKNWKEDKDNQSTFTCNVLKCKDKKGNAISWLSGQTYTLRCKVTENWIGDPKQTRTVYQDLVFTIWDQERLQVAKNMDFEFSPTTVDKGEPTSFLVSLKESCLDMAKSSGIISMGVRYSYYEPKKNRDGEITGYEKKTENDATYADIIKKSTQFGNNTWYIGKDVVLKPKAAGPIEVYIDMYTSNGLFLDTKTYKIFAMPALTGRFEPSKEYAVPEDGYTLTARYASWNAQMNSGLADFATMTDYSVSANSVIWQYCALGGSQFEDIRSGDTGVSFDPNNILVSNRTGYYRASYQFQGARYYSPRSILLIATDYDSNYQPYITSQGSGYEEFGKNAIITVNRNADANWVNVRDYTLICRSFPAGARLRNNQVTKTTNEFTLERDFLYSNVTAETFVPGNYAFEAKVRHANGTATSFRFVITYNVTSSGFTFSVNDDKAERLSNGDGKYRMLSADDSTFKVGCSVYPANSSLAQYPEKKYNYTFVNLTQDIISLTKDGTATVLAPGDAKIELKIVDATTGVTVASPTLTVTIPVVGFEVEEPNYNDYLGDYWSNVKATVKSVWGPGGRKITANADQYVSVTVKSTQGTGFSEKVEYDNRGDIEWMAQTKSGYQFPMEVVYTSYNSDGDMTVTGRADVYKIQTNAFTDKVKTASEHGSYRNENPSGYYTYTVGKTGDDPTSAFFTLTSKNVHVENPNIKYIDVVSVNTGTPKVGDPRYEGTDSSKYYSEYMTVDLGSLSDLLNADKKPIVSAQTLVSKLDSITGSGKPYDNAFSESTIEYTDVWNYSGGNILTGTPNKPTKKYETGIYKNSLKLTIFGKDASGAQYRFAPEVKLFVNGHLIEFATTTYANQDFCYLNADYYFDVGDVTQYSSATVDATDITPTIGMKPKGIDSVSVEGTNDIEVTKLLWFVDANDNGKYDFGEEASAENGNLNSDGTFMANKKYSVDLEVGVADGAEGRLASPFSLKVKYDNPTGTATQTKEQIVSTFYPNGVFNFPYYPISAGATVYGAATSFGSQTDDVTIQLIKSGESEAAYETIVQGNTVGYSIENVAPGTYTMKVMKKNHATREYKVTVGTANVKQDVKIQLLGDVDGNGKVETTDVLIMNQYLAKINVACDIKAADLNGNGEVDTVDVLMLNQILAGMTVKISN